MTRDQDGKFSNRLTWQPPEALLHVRNEVIMCASMHETAYIYSTAMEIYTMKKGSITDAHADYK